jgi:dihydrofolate reductase
MGHGGETGPDNDIVKRIIERTGADVMGRRMFGEGEVGWPEEAPFHHDVFVVTHQPREPWVRTGTTFHFVFDGQTGLDAATTHLAYRVKG